MLKIIKRIALFGLIGLFALGLPSAQDDQTGDPHATGLIPLTALEKEQIASTWPRITRVGINRLGFERVNEVRARKGKPALDPLSVEPVGDEVRGVLPGRAASVLAAAANEDLAADLPVSVDNSQLRFFPPIRSQGSLGACVSFAITYYQMSYMTAFQRNLDIRDSGNANKYSPKWTYNMVNGGSDSGSSFYQTYNLLERNGAATWQEFPYDSNFRAWCLDPMAWRNALGVRTKAIQYVNNASTATGLELIKELLTDGYVVVYGTYISSWVFTAASDDPSTSDDDAAAGKSVGYWLNGSNGGHAMTIVGFNDAVWTDINTDGVIDAGEKGAFRIANSWGTGWREGGFTWLAYDALRNPSAVAGAPSGGRVAAFQGDQVFVLTARNGYAPLMIGEFTVNHAKRGQMRLTLGRSNTAATVPAETWFPAALLSQGGAYAFDGSTIGRSRDLRPGFHGPPGRGGRAAALLPRNQRRHGRRSGDLERFQDRRHDDRPGCRGGLLHSSPRRSTPSRATLMSTMPMPGRPTTTRPRSRLPKSIPRPAGRGSRTRSPSGTRTRTATCRP